MNGPEHEHEHDPHRLPDEPPQSDEPPRPPEPPQSAGHHEPPEPPQSQSSGPRRSPDWRDRAAVALGNASLFGLGYLLLGRKRPAAAAALGTCILFALTAQVAATWCEILLLSWWAAGVAHGWFLAGAPAERLAGRGRRVSAFAVTGAVLLTAVLLRVDAYGIEDRVDEARERGDCAAAVAAQEEVRADHRMAGGPVAGRGDAVVEACDRLEEAAVTLAGGARHGNVGELKSGFAAVARVLREPGNGKTAGAVLDGFLDALPTGDACNTADVAEWLGDRKPIRGVPDRSAATAARTEPAALVGCGDDLMDEDEWRQARANYQRLLDEYPDDDRTDEARGGVRKATRAMELAEVRRLVETSGPGTESGYCDKPAKYSGAPRYRKGDAPALFLGDSEYTGELPGGWRTDDPAEAALVVCADEAKNGPAVETCSYENPKSEYLPHRVTFRKVEIPLKIYELRTGKRVGPRKVRIGGGSCPQVLRYTSYGPTDLGPPGDQFVSTGKSDVKDAFRPVLKR